jgi:hypothetical protein
LGGEELKVKSKIQNPGKPIAGVFSSTNNYSAAVL